MFQHFEEGLFKGEFNLFPVHASAQHLAIENLYLVIFNKYASSFLKHLIKPQSHLFFLNHLLSVTDILLLMIPSASS